MSTANDSNRRWIFEYGQSFIKIIFRSLYDAEHPLRLLGLTALLVCMAQGLAAAQYLPADQGRNDLNASEVPVFHTGLFRGRQVMYQIINGRPIFEGDIILDHVQQKVPALGSAQPFATLGVAYNQYLWPQVSGVAQVPYIVTQPAPTALNDAITTFNQDLSGVIQFVPRSTQANYVNFDFNPNDQSQVCESNVGMIGGEQSIGGSIDCTLPGLLHEMGHTVGLWHEQQRPDRNSYVKVEYQNIIKGFYPDFNVLIDNAETFGLYDYASIMHYYPFAFSRNGGPTIESIPAGIPLSNTVGYTAGDIDGIERLYGATPSSVTITSNPPGLQVIVDNSTYTTPQTFSWALNSQHTLAVANGAQTLDGTTYLYGRWNDNGAQIHTITVAPGNGQTTEPITYPGVTVYGAEFVELTKLVFSVYPKGAGKLTEKPAPMTITGVNGKFYVIRQKVTFTATPNAGYNFYGWFAYYDDAQGANPKTMYILEQPLSPQFQAGFTPDQVTTINTTPGDPNDLGAIIDGGFWYTPKNFSPYYDSGWTPGSSHSISVDSPQYPLSYATRYAFSSWSDSGAQTHDIVVPTGNSAFTASLIPQYLPIDIVNQSCAGSIALSPPSPQGDGFYDTGTTVTFDETPVSGWKFAGWQGDLSGLTNPQSPDITGEEAVYANYNTAAKPLSITSLSPPNAQAGGSGFTLTINGTGFTKKSLVFINSNYRSGTTFVSSTQITVPIYSSDIATAGGFQVGVENFPPGATCAAWYPVTFLVLN
jgi:Astacin (Peptidase family M12A)/Divergent InlB B-repeat domain